LKQVLINSGQVSLSEVPSPTLQRGEVLVQVEFSCLSAGTEMAGISSSSIPLWKKAYKNPAKALQTIKSMDSSPKQVWRLIEKKKKQTLPTGYSASGKVISVGEGVKDFFIGDKVACSGSESAFHAEFISVPENLCTKVPDKVTADLASTVTMGAIAMQGIRRAGPTLGETFVVIGLGLLGQITIQILKANGCRVIAIDLEDHKVQLANSLGADFATTDNEDAETHVANLTNGYGADGIIITAASSSDDIVSKAFNYSRKKGRVIIVGDVGLKLNRSDFYEKEIDILISSSYGPGRYDRNYEDEGLDYPISYVRWTENRNMQEYLNLLAEKKISINPLISNVFSLNNAVEAYQSLSTQNPKPIINLLEYPCNEVANSSLHLPNVPWKEKSDLSVINLAILGVGAFTTSTHLPNLQILKDDFSIKHVINRSGHKAKEIAEAVNSEFASTNYLDALNDKDVNAVLISTRHNLHAEMIIASLKSNKNIFVEKPLALNESELSTIDDALKEIKNNPPIIMTGFNRRFSQIAVEINKILVERKNPFILNYVMNAGFIPLDHWTQTKEGGGRNIGEACHIYDLFLYFAGSEISNIQASNIKKTSSYSNTDNFNVSLTFLDGSVCNLIYSSMGSLNYPKETAQIFVDGKIITMENYKSLKIYDGEKAISRYFKGKGHLEELKHFSRSIKGGGAWPISWQEQKLSSQISFEVEKLIQT
tara:strand:+ start:1204 stop:3333 length:2130 start_codon:yes stop_codon:yes gene_type:complete